MYDELVKRLREEASSWCVNCCYRTEECICAAPDNRKRDCDIYSKLEAADVIEHLDEICQHQADEIKELQQITTHYEEESKGWWLAACDAKEEGERLKEQIPKWISVEERLPEEYELVLTCDDRQNIHMMSHTKKYKYPFGISPVNPRYYMVKYWMPLPEPPKEET